MKRYCQAGLLLICIMTAATAQEDPAETVRLTPRIDIELQPVPVLVPEHFDHLPAGLSLNLPPGFSARMYAAFESVRRPRFMAFDDEGVLHVTNMNDDEIVALPDHDGDGFADEAIVVAEGFVRPHSLAFFGGDLYVGDRPEIVRLRDLDGDGVYEEREVFAGDIPSSGAHSTRTLVIDEAGGKMYLSVGWPCDLCRNRDTERGAILQFNLDGSGRRVFANGVRNVVGMALHPATGALWGTNNGHDLQGIDAPPEWIDIIRDGGFYGIPLAYGYQKWIDFTIPTYRDEILPLTQEDTLRVNSMQPPVSLVPAHTAPMGIHFYNHTQFPSRYRHAAFVALHAGHAKLAPIEGYSVVALFSEPDGSNARIADFITGFQTGTEIDEVWGYPMGITTDAAGNLYVSSDLGIPGILRIEHSPIIADWSHNLPDTLHAGTTLALDATVQIERLVAGAEPPVVTADLSALGGPETIVLSETETNSFRLQLNMIAPVNVDGGRKVVSVTVRQEGAPGLAPVRLTKTVALVGEPLDEDIVIFDEALAPGWTVSHKTWRDGLSARLDDDDFVHTGEVAASFRGSSSRDWDWATRFRPDQPIDPIGYHQLSFAFHPGNLKRSGTPEFNVYAAGTLINLSRDGAVDMTLKEWQEVVVPLSAFGARPIQEVTFGGDFPGRYYVDDLRLVVAPISTAVLEDQVDPSPGPFALEQNYPNPFNSSTQLRFALPSAVQVSLEIYSITGQRVARLVEGAREAGNYTVAWDGKNDQGHPLATGVYFSHLRAGQWTQTRKLVLLR
jgi:glucose/arabinose dehydrogenase